ncbi:MAG TPA: sigma-54-dependent Fis family transcriptional regulator, partial [Nitrospiraceae bacterium]|nr:sigma-54-dependent Fis family transcriptional regulator [Nitrospiraceae bacterium]
IFFNRAAEEITGYRKEEVMGKQCIILDTDTCMVLTESGMEKRCNLFKTGSVRNRKCRIRSKDGRSVYLLKNAVVLRNSNNEIIGAVETMTDITSLYLKELEIEELKRELRQEYWFMSLLGGSAVMQRLYEQIRNVASSEAPILIYGESGTGKDLVTRAIHALSRHKDGPFIKVNCASLNECLLESELFGHRKGSFTNAIHDREGRFEAANNGSIFLDEIGDMSMLMQAKLLRVLEEKVVERVGDHRPIPVNIRLISATNKDLCALVSEGKFREDLLYRVNSISIQTPPLRERKEDIPILIAHYLKKISLANNKDIQRISPKAMDIMANYRWPGNVRQLINAIEHSAITCRSDTINVSDLPDYIFHEKKIEGDGRFKRDKIGSVLSMYNGNRTLTAKHLGISRVTLWKHLKDLGI